MSLRHILCQVKWGQKPAILGGIFDNRNGGCLWLELIQVHLRSKQGDSRGSVTYHRKQEDTVASEEWSQAGPQYFLLCTHRAEAQVKNMGMLG